MQPDIVLVICDDIGYGDLGCYGSTMIDTPRLNALAEQGVRFSAFYSGAPTCTPSRAALLTGRHAPRTGADSVIFPGGADGLHHAEVTLAALLQTAGYTTSAIGKWHLGQMPDRGPLRFGFDHYFGLPFSNDMEPLAVYRDEDVIEEEADVALLTSRYLARSVQEIAGASPDVPLFQYVAFTMPHYPVSPSPEWKGRSAAGDYGDVCQEIDDAVGRIHDALVTRGREFILVFTSDHGPWFEGSTAGLRGRKFETWDGGMRVPMIVTGVGVQRLEALANMPFASVDVLPTILDLAGVDADLPTVDGASLADAVDPTGRPIWFFDGLHINAVRRGPWKLHRRRQTWGADRHAQWSLPQLFNLELDPAESYDLASRDPGMVAELSALCEAMEKELSEGAGQGTPFL